MGLFITRVIASHLKQLIVVSGFIVLVVPVSFSQKKWTGSFSGKWDNPLNWQPAGVPFASDDVVLDNSISNNDYKVTLPDQFTGIHSLVIEPAAGSKIELILPATNVSSPGLQVYESGNGIVIREGGIFRNSSGLNSGQSLLLNGLFCIYNNGTYVHNSRSAHAADVVAKLSTAAGTEKGIFEYDVPGGSYPISLSNRSYGTLVFSSAASGGTQTYNASGTNPVIINGDLRINNGVQFNVDLTKDMVINGSYIQAGGVFNIASQTNNNVVIIRGDVSQNKSALITETAAGLPVLELAGNSQQLVSFAGSFGNSVTLRINNSGGILLLDHLTLAFKMQLVKGKIKSSTSAFITLLDDCTVSGASSDSFVEGPLRKIGDDNFEFPVGKEGDFAPVKISGGGDVTDEFTATYFLSNPSSVYGPSFESPPVVRISSLEYWTLERSAGTKAKKVSLEVGTYSQATALEHLVVVRWDKQASSWRNAGNSSYSGFATGSITSNELNDFGPLTLGSTTVAQNPLPLALLDFTADIKAGVVDLKWEAEEDVSNYYYDVEKSLDGKLYHYVARVPRGEGTRKYRFSFPLIENRNMFYRLKIVGEHGSIFYSEPVNILFGAYDKIKIYPLVVRNELNLEMHKGVPGRLEIIICDFAGRMLQQFTRDYNPGKNIIKLDAGELAKGTYILRVKELNRLEKSYIFFKQ